MNNDFEFRLQHLILWAKGWYRPIDETEDMFETLLKIFRLDGYEFIDSWKDIISITLNQIDRYNSYNISKGQEPLRLYMIYKEFLSAKQIADCSHSLGKSDDEILFMVIKNFLFQEITSDLIKIKPHYTRKLFKIGLTGPSMFKKGTSYKTMQKYADEIFH